VEVLDRPGSADAEQSSLHARTGIVQRGLAVDDVVVAFGLLAAGACDPAAADRLRAAGSGELPRVIGELVTQGHVDRQHWADLQRMWYRWRIPLGVSSLVWWHLFCVAWGRSRDMVAATDLAEAWIDALDAALPAERAALTARLTGQSAADGVVALRDDITGLGAFVAAARHGVPLVGVEDTAALQALRGAGVAVLLSDIEQPDAAGADLPRVRSGAASLRVLCYGRAPRFAGQTAALRAFWCDMPVEERTLVLVHLEQKLACLEIVRLSHGSQVMDNNEIAAVLTGCRERAPAQWTPLQLRFATFGWAWQEGGFSIHEYNQAELSLPMLRLVLEHRTGLYASLTGRAPAQGQPFTEFVRDYARERLALERTHQRCLYFDGGNWERREFLLERSAIVRHFAIPASLAASVVRDFGGTLSAGAAPEDWRRWVGERLDHGRTPTELMIALAEWAANADDVPVDYAVFDMPVGIKLDRPWELEIEDIFCYTGLRKGFDARGKAVPLGDIGIANALGQRMRYNAVKKAQNYALVKRMTPQSFLLPDVSVAEDAHHGGHYASGIRHACRVPIAVGWRGSAWRGIADVRLSRSDYAADRRFREEELEVAMRYGIWAKAIADEAYARGLMFDARYCVNLDDGRDVAGSLGRPA
jgi:hypothetical protein